MNKTRLLSALLLVAAVSACGQKGPLFLPGDPGQVRSGVPASGEPADERQDDGEDDEDDEQRR